ncbi:YncE family protein [Candidatus Nitrosocosmicus sp. FF01]|uniref:YncE family protein n=1 Tax=Candidatus Nitrosocosmicus sp. FF01 TaxID=3397670 RepID=UPI0039EA7AB0
MASLFYYINDSAIGQTLESINEKYHTTNPQLEIGLEPNEVKVDKFLNKVYVANERSNSISILDSNVGTLKEIFINTIPHDVEENDKIHHVYISGKSPSETISIIDGRTDELLQNIPLEQELTDIEVNEKESKLYLAGKGGIRLIDDTGSNSLSIDLVKKYDVEANYTKIAVDEEAEKVYVINQYPPELLIFDNDLKLLGNISIPDKNEPLDIEVNEKDHSVYIITEKNFYKQNNDTTMTGIELINAPRTLEVNENSNTVYIISDRDVSIINGTSNIKVDKVIPLFGPLLELEVNENSDVVYLLSKHNLYSLNEKTNKLSNINISEPLSNIEVNENSNIVYLTSEDSDSLFTIHGPKHKIAVGITFNVFPLNAGRIICGEEKIEYPINQYFYEEPGMICNAKANSGFEFVNWNENIDSNTTRPLKPCVEDSKNPFDPLMTPIQKTWQIYNDTAETSFCINQYGTFTANFRELPAPLPIEYWIPIYGLIISTIIGASIPSIILWARTKRDIKKSIIHLKKLKTIYEEGRRDEVDLESLNKLKDEISDSFSKGKISQFHYSNLKEEISILYHEIFMKKIDSLDDDKGANLSSKLKLIREIKDAFSKGKITELHYNMLMNKVSETEKY